MIDFHVHVGRLNKEYPYDFSKEMMQACLKKVEDISVDPENLIMEMDNHNISKAIILGFNAKRTLGVHVSNQYVAEICQKWPERFVGFGSFDVAYEEITLKVLRLEMGKLGLKGFKIPFGYLDLSPADERWLPIYQYALEYELPLLLHMGYSPIKKVNHRYCNPILLDKVLQTFPNLRIVIAHLGWPWVDETIYLLKKYQNVYTDTSIVTFYQSTDFMVNMFQKLCHEKVMNKVIWGTDYPMCTFKESLDSMKKILACLNLQETGPSEAEIKLMFSENAQKLIKC